MKIKEFKLKWNLRFIGQHFYFSKTNFMNKVFLYLKEKIHKK